MRDTRMKTRFNYDGLIVVTLFMLVILSAKDLPAQAETTSGKRSGADADLAQSLTNPLADLMTIPIQMNYDRDIGVQDEGWKLQTNVQPVIPVDLTRDWMLITRTILPVIYQDDVFAGAGSQFGLGDTSLSLFLSPQRTGFRQCDLGRRTDFPFADGNRFQTGCRQMGCGADGSRAHNARAVDHRCTGQSHLVFCGRQRWSGHQQHVVAALCGVHMAERLDRVDAVRDYL